MSKPIVSIVKGPKNPSIEQITQMITKAVNLIGGIDTIVKPGDIVLIKPNLVSKVKWETGAVTSPITVEAIIHMLKGVKPKEIIIGESSGIGLKTEEIFVMNGYDKLSKRLNVKLLDLNEDQPVKVDIPKGKVLKKVKIWQTVLESDVVINVPVMKPHVLASVSLGLKNMKGVIPPEEKRKFHLIGLEQAIADLSLAIKANLTIVDGITGQEGLAAPVHLGDPVQLDLIIAGQDPVATDAVTAAVMGFDPQKINHLKYANTLGVGVLDLDEIETRGESIEKIRYNFRRPIVDLKSFKNVRIIEKGACSTCLAGVYTALKVMEKAGEVQKIGKITYMLGPLAHPPKAQKGPLIVIGRCLKKFKDSGYYVPGCPPQVFLIRDETREVMGLPRLFGSKEPYMKEAD